MSDRTLGARLARIGAAAAVLALVVVLSAWGLSASGHDRGAHAAATAGAGASGAPIPAPGPNPSEADVFRLAPGRTTLAMDAERRPDARVRDLASYRRLRAYPGAPPAIPHEVDAAALRTQRCNSCHARGGWVAAQGAYTPVTPHPDYLNCMQCHVAGAEGGLWVPSAFTPAEWPAIDRQAMTWADDGGTPGSSPPPISHSLQLRGNCLACHAGPAAVAEVRTTHPERANCRQCHAARDDVGAARGASAAGQPADAFSREVR